MSISVKSEIKPLRKVLLHRPGKELENLIPEHLERLLFDDIPHLEVAQQEHDYFAKVLNDNGVEVLYLHELAAQAIEDEAIKTRFITQFIEEAGIKDPFLKEQLSEYFSSFTDNEVLVQQTMAGLNKNQINLKKKNFSDYVEQSNPFLLDPMPNLYFTRDPFASIGNSVSINKMYSATRNRETIYADYIFKYHPDFKTVPRVFDRNFNAHIEGGDILNLNDEVLAVGISQRTEPRAIEELAKNIFFKTEANSIRCILAFKIPKSRAYMHLDTVFSQLDYHKFMIHPQIEGPLEVYELTPGDNGTLNFIKEEMTLKDILLKNIGINVQLIPCGGGDYITSQREQWNDGSNTLCIKPGEVIVYSRNYVSNRVLEEHEIKTHVIPASEISRGRGGPRCMSMPLRRQE